jgi:hypothetical protein
LPILEIAVEDTGETPISVASFLTEIRKRMKARSAGTWRRRRSATFFSPLHACYDRFLNLGQLIGRRYTAVRSLKGLRRTAKSGEMVYSERRGI